MTIVHAALLVILLPLSAIAYFVIKDRKEQEQLNRMWRNIQIKKQQQGKKTHELL